MVVVVVVVVVVVIVVAFSGAQTDAAWNNANRPDDGVFECRTPNVFAILPIATHSLHSRRDCAD